jgi:hypothetical protein
LVQALQQLAVERTGIGHRRFALNLFSETLPGGKFLLRRISLGIRRALGCFFLLIEFGLAEAGDIKLPHGNAHGATPQIHRTGFFTCLELDVGTLGDFDSYRSRPQRGPVGRLAVLPRHGEFQLRTLGQLIHHLLQLFALRWQ